MKYIASLNISTSGTNGPMGKNVSYYNGPYFRIPGNSFTGISGAYDTAALDSGNGFNVFSKIVENSVILENFRKTGQMDMAAVITARIALLVPPAAGGSSDPCCQASDWEIMNGNCPKDPTDDWWIVPECNCDRFSSDPGYGAGGPFGTEVECYRNTTCGSSFRCVDGACQETYYGYYPTIEDCIGNCPLPRVTPSPSSPPPTSPPTIYAFKCQSGTCVDCEQNPGSCTDKDCTNNPNYYCSTVKNTASQNCTNNCHPDPTAPPNCSGNSSYSWNANYGSWELETNNCGPYPTCRRAPQPDRPGSFDGEIVYVGCVETPYPAFSFISEDTIIW